MKIYKVLTLFFVYAFVSGCADEDPTFDINFPQPEITDITPASAEVETPLTIVGTGFTEITRIDVGGAEVDSIVSMSKTEIVVIVPRIVTSTDVVVRNRYDKRSASPTAFSPIYPATTVTEWPTDVNAEGKLRVKGENMDFVNEAQINGTDVSIVGANPSSLQLDTKGLGLVEGQSISVSLNAYGEITNGKSTVNVAPALTSFIPVVPIVLFDFEEGDPFTNGGTGVTASIDGGSVPKGRGDHYFHAETAQTAGKWITYGTMTSEEIDPEGLGFTDAHISFLVNTNGQEGYFHMNLIQGGQTIEAHFNRAPDEYKFKTDGWEWRSYTLDPSSEEAGEFKADFDRSQPFQMQLVVRAGNIEMMPFELNIDQVMITDGQVNPSLTLFDFEDANDPFTNDGTGVTASIDGGAVPNGRGDHYFHAETPQTAGKWITYGTLTTGVIDPAAEGFSDPYITFLVNTEDAQGYFHMNLLQGGQAIEAHFNRAPDEYKFKTDGWEWRSYPLNPASEEAGEFKAPFDPTQPFEVQLVVRAGNIENEPFKLNVDQIMITDGKAVF